MKAASIHRFSRLPPPRSSVSEYWLVSLRLKFVGDFVDATQVVAEERFLQQREEAAVFLDVDSLLDKVFRTFLQNPVAKVTRLIQQLKRLSCEVFSALSFFPPTTVLNLLQNMIIC